jgi:hypothetical protein
VGEDLWAPPLLAGSTIAEVGNRFDGDVLGADPRATWSAASAGAVRAVGEHGAMDWNVHLSFGDVPGRESAGACLWVVGIAPFRMGVTASRGYVWLSAQSLGPALAQPRVSARPGGAR